jgi:hypothetical protein
MSKKPSGRRKPQQAAACGWTWSDHVVVAERLAKCNRCGAEGRLEGPYDPEAIDAKEEPKRKAEQAAGRQTYLDQVWDFLLSHRACLPKQSSTGKKTAARKQKGLFG